LTMSQHENQLAHVASVKTLVGNFAALIALTVITVLATRIDFGGQGNLVVALLIAGMKATLVALFFMHLRYDRMFHTLAIVLGLLTMLLFFALTVIDTGAYREDMHWQSPAPAPVASAAAPVAAEASPANSTLAAPAAPAAEQEGSDAAPEGTAPAAPAAPEPAVPAAAQPTAPADGTLAPAAPQPTAPAESQSPDPTAAPQPAAPDAPQPPAPAGAAPTAPIAPAN
jgi:cytochrome c oxidase subunit IV